MAGRKENMGKIVIYIILALIIAGAVYGTVRRVRHGSACCGEHEAAPKKIRASDTNKKNYQYLYELRVDGMHCSNCARRVENAFNSQDGLWALADIGEKTVTLRSKKALDDSYCRELVSGAGYTLLSMKQKDT